MSFEWQWDAIRQAYYYWSEVENTWVYQDGTRFPAATSSTTLTQTG
jgi:hypothetical protein